MSSLCATFRDGLPRYLAEALSGSERASFRTHLAECAGCRQAAFAREPSLLFAALPPAGGDAKDSLKVSLEVLEGVRSAIAMRKTEERLEKRGSRRRTRRLLAGAAAALLAAAAWLVPSSARRVGSRRRADVLLPAASRAEPLSPASATVYEWNPEAAGATEPKIVWIVDRSFDI